MDADESALRSRSETAFEPTASPVSMWPSTTSLRMRCSRSKTPHLANARVSCQSSVGPPASRAMRERSLGQDRRVVRRERVVEDELLRAHPDGAGAGEHVRVGEAGARE